jgi:hypothetical protein
LAKDLENKTPRSFRLGSKLYSENLIWIFNRVTALTPFLKAIIKELHEKMFRLADNLWPKYMKSTPKSDTLQLIKMVIDKISLQHTTPLNFNWK